MPKDAKKNIDRYKIRGGELNEFDFHQNQKDYVGEKSLTGKNPIPTKATKGTKETRTAPIRGATAKTLAAQKAAKKK
jgi:hypothetical protein